MPGGNVATKLNRLERAIIGGEDAANDARWAQAREVARLVRGGTSQRDIAAAWINGRTDRPYTKQHVSYCKIAWERWGSIAIDRPTWTTAYYTIQQGSDELIHEDDRRQQWSDAHEARAPKSIDTAARLVANIGNAPVDVQDEIFHGLQQQRAHGDYTPPAERKAREADAAQRIKPVRDGVDQGFGKLGIVLALEQATETLREMVEADTLNATVMRAIDAADVAWQQELDVARARLGLEA